MVFFCLQLVQRKQHEGPQESLWYVSGKLVKEKKPGKRGKVPL